EVEPPHIGTFSEVLYTGMGGSGIAGDYAAAVAAPAGTRVAVHKGYGTAFHMAALRELWPSREHRRSWANVRAVVGARENARGFDSDEADAG
ncbi:MAG: hypothetical protein LOY04_11570, partial [Rhodococcus ruber]|nr:hypothetical protein [Rhodococcus ruber]